MSEPSWRHHYLPVFYLKGFTKNSGKLKIYDVINKKFVDGGKEYSTKSYFFEKDANTFIKDGVKSDFIEEYYSDFENKISKLVTSINLLDSSERFGVTEKDMPLLQFFTSLMYWRLPHRKEEIETILSNSNLLDLGLKIVDDEGRRDYELEEKMKHNIEFRKFFRLYNAMTDSVGG